MEGVYTLKDCDLAPLVVEPDMNMIYSTVPAHLSDVDLSLVVDPSLDFSCRVRFKFWVCFICYLKCKNRSEIWNPPSICAYGCALLDHSWTVEFDLSSECVLFFFPMPVFWNHISHWGIRGCIPHYRCWNHLIYYIAWVTTSIAFVFFLFWTSLNRNIFPATGFKLSNFLTPVDDRYIIFFWLSSDFCGLRHIMF